MSPTDLTLVAKHVMKLLVERRFEELAAAAQGEGLSADDMAGAIDDVGGPPAMPPEHVWRDLRFRSIAGRPGAWSLTLHLWTAHGRTPATVELTAYTRNGRPVVQVDDIIST
ncbi:MAG: hypothetical protein RBT71_13715 [Flavobacteriales bacterium]|jgi:hypothetical protein|nr:hypothetical protein [Flavobacteriales bacterium]